MITSDCSSPMPSSALNLIGFPRIGLDVTGCLHRGEQCLVDRHIDSSFRLVRSANPTVAYIRPAALPLRRKMIHTDRCDVGNFTRNSLRNSVGN